ncbi:MAG: hypothetical protein KHY17_03560, partial [Collinsella sp.]|nr:hypothetical protein [Collinsella sp.]
ERLKAGTEFKRLKKGHRPAPMPPTWTHILSYKPKVQLVRRIGFRASAARIRTGFARLPADSPAR